MLSAGARGTCSQVSGYMRSNVGPILQILGWILTDRHLCSVRGDYVVYHLLDSRPDGHLGILKSGKLRIYENQVLVDSRTERYRLEGGAEVRKDGRVILISKGPRRPPRIESCLDLPCTGRSRVLVLQSCT